MTKGDVSQEFRRKKLKQINNYFIKEIGQNELLTQKHKKVCLTLNYIEQLLTLVLAVSICISISVFSSLIDVCVIIAWIKNYNSISKERKRSTMK